MSAMRAKTSASQAFGSMSLRRAVMISVAITVASCHSACNIDPLSRGIGVQNWL